MVKKRTFSVIGKNIVKIFLNKTILDDLNITVQKQSIYALLGENGIGKSVLLKCLMGTLSVDGGHVVISEENPVSTTVDGNQNISSRISYISDLSDDHHTDSTGDTTTADHPEIGFAPQDFNASGSTKIYQLLSFVSATNGLSKTQIIKRYKVMATMIGLPKSNSLVNCLCYGQRKTLSLVLAIIHEPELIVLDDFTSGVDTKTLKNIWTLLQYMNRFRECTIIVAASNNFSFMETVVTHIGILANGKIIEENTTIHLITKYKALSIDDLLTTVILAGHKYRYGWKANSIKINKFPNITSSIPQNNTTLLDSVFAEQTHSINKKKIYSSTIIWNLIKIKLKMNIQLMAVIILMFSVIFPLVIRLSFGAVPKFRDSIIVLNHETHVTFNKTKFGECNRDLNSTKSLSCLYLNKFLTKHFEIIYVDKSKIDQSNSYENNGIVIEFPQNYSMILQQRIERKIKHNSDLEEGHMKILINLIDGRKADYITYTLIHNYKRFLAYCAHNMYENYITDTNEDSINYTYRETTSSNYPLYARYMNSGLIVISSFFLHALITVWLMKTASEANHDHYHSQMMMYLTDLIIQIPIAMLLNVFSIFFAKILYTVKINKEFTLFINLLLESICGIHFAKISYIFLNNNDFKICVLLYFYCMICLYESGFWWPIDYNDWKYLIHNLLPITSGMRIVRGLIDYQYLNVKCLIIVFSWTVIFVVITVINVTQNNKLKLPIAQ